MAARAPFNEHHVIIEGSTRHHGIALWPPPSNDPHDPLRWSRWLKISALLSTAICNFTSNFAGAGPSVAVPLFQMEFMKSVGDVNSLLTQQFNFLLLGLGNMFWVPFAVKFGKRAALITSMALLFAVLCWTATAKTFNSLLAARCISGFAASAGESIVPSIVSDLFFLHERAGMMSIYVIFTASSTALGPLIAGYIVQYAPGTWRDYVWVSAALAGFNLVVLILLYPESNFHRSHVAKQPTIAQKEHTVSGADKTKGFSSQLDSLGENGTTADTHGVQHVDHIRVPWTSIWFSFLRVDHQVSLLTVAVRPLIALIHPAVVWGIFVYGASLAAQVILIFALPSLLFPPPYLFTPSGVGLMQVAALIGFIVAMIGGGYVADIITVKRIIKEGGVSYPEQRLLALIPGCLISPAGCILIAFACAEKLHWVAIAFGFGMISFGTVYAPNIAITYVVERYQDIAAEALVIINAFNNLVAFIFLYVAVDWIQARGWIEVYMILFMLISVVTMAAIPLYIWGERLGARVEATRIHQKFLTTKYNDQDSN
ncbi:hypothetical protein B0A49_12905 [Cryomyces minteri]|uniref:Major facilitator superfamily (MFS) profile domain-containing protein n=1 Tax=Cryomyces minteri TaxID=331657 RepID=A0A4U0W8D5_9PEZI|nr:hypothetical protein B0A49_12709 [Cryomyces minteri]TKA50038.1 hypothetical protein B0A49_12615 [Cryomyces minteri]TKA58601.1 hypothetical protein B0A49_12905 [Cryomyces minteri]